MRTDEINLIVSDLDNCKDLKLLKAVIKIQAGLLKNRDRTINKLKSIAEEYQESYVQIEQENKKLQIQVKHLSESLNESYKHYR